MNPALLKQIVRFLLSGAINTGVTYAIYLLLLPHLDYRSAYSVSFLCGIVLSYAINVRYVFRVRAGWKSFALYPLVYLAQYLIGILILYVAVDKFGIAREYALLASIAVSVPVTFLISRTILAPPASTNG